MTEQKQVFSRKEILGQLDNVLAAPHIATSNVLSEFLRFIVFETLEGRGDDLKEYTIGVNALKRAAGFNPQIDSIVRIHAGRLRRSLKEYYYETGVNDEIVISIPKGSYQPVFESRPVKTSNSLAELGNGYHHDSTGRLKAVNENGHVLWHKINVAVLPFRHIGLDEELVNFSDGMGEYVSTELTSFNDLRVVSYYLGSFAASQPTDIRTLGRTLNARYFLTGSVQSLKPIVRVWVQLSDCLTGDQLWAHTFERQHESKELGQFQEEIVDRVLGGITGVNGAISKNETKGKHSDDSRVSISYWYTRYTNSFNPGTMKHAIAFYESVLKKEPDNAQALGFLGEILAGESLLPGSKGGGLERATAYSRMAIKLDPSWQQGYQALAINLLLARKKAECIQILNQGLALNPKSTDFQGGMGALLIFAGEFEKGAKCVTRAMELTPNLPWWQIFSLSFYSYVAGKYREAIFLTTKMEIDIVWIPIIKAASYAELGEMEEAKSIMMELKVLFPTVDLTSPSALDHLFYSDEMINAISGGLKKIC
jgi:TolB-like protein